MPNRERKILLTEYDLKRIQNLNIEFRFYQRNKSIIKSYIYEMIKKDGSCIFLSDNGCTIYEHRPLICRFYPFTMTKTTDYIFRTDNACKGIGCNKLVARKYFQELVEEAEKTLK